MNNTIERAARWLSSFHPRSSVEQAWELGQHEAERFVTGQSSDRVDEHSLRLVYPESRDELNAWVTSPGAIMGPKPVANTLYDQDTFDLDELREAVALRLRLEGNPPVLRFADPWGKPVLLQLVFGLENIEATARAEESHPAQVVPPPMRERRPLDAKFRQYGDDTWDPE